MAACSVLVLGTRKNGSWTDGLAELGVQGVFVQNVQSLLMALHHKDHGGVVYDPIFTDEDVLELALNIRDIDPQVPLMVVQRQERLAAESMLFLLNGMHRLEGPDSHLAAKVVTLMKNGPERVIGTRGIETKKGHRP